MWKSKCKIENFSHLLHQLHIGYSIIHILWGIYLSSVSKFILANVLYAFCGKFLSPSVSKYILATVLYTFCGAYITKMVAMTVNLQHFLILGTRNKIFHFVKVIMNIRMLLTCQVVEYTSKIGSYKIKRVTLTVKRFKWCIYRKESDTVCRQFIQKFTHMLTFQFIPMTFLVLLEYDGKWSLCMFSVEILVVLGRMHITVIRQQSFVWMTQSLILNE